MREEEIKNAIKQKLGLVSDLHEKLLIAWDAFGRKQNERDACVEKLQTSHAILTKEIVSKRVIAKEYVEVIQRYEGLMAQIKFNKDKINQINERMFAEIKNLHRPPVTLQHVIIGCLFLLGLRFRTSANFKSRSSRKKKIPISELWTGCKKYLVSESGLQMRLQKINYWTLKPENVNRTREFVLEHKESFAKERIRCVSRVGEVMAEIVQNMLEVHGLLAGYGNLLEVHRKKDALLTEVYSLVKRQSEIGSRLTKLKQISSTPAGEEGFLNEAKAGNSALKKFLSRLDRVVENQMVAVDDLQRINYQLGETDDIEEHFMDSPSLTFETDLDDMSSLAELR